MKSDMAFRRLREYRPNPHVPFPSRVFSLSDYGKMVRGTLPVQEVNPVVSQSARIMAPDTEQEKGIMTEKLVFLSYGPDIQ